MEEERQDLEVGVSLEEKEREEDLAKEEKARAAEEKGYTSSTYGAEAATPGCRIGDGTAVGAITAVCDRSVV